MANIDWSTVGITNPNAYTQQFIPEPTKPANMSDDEWLAWSAKMDNARKMRDEDVGE
jgi:hypothetical protein